MNELKFSELLAYLVAILVIAVVAYFLTNLTVALIVFFVFSVTAVGIFHLGRFVNSGSSS